MAEVFNDEPRVIEPKLSKEPNVATLRAGINAGAKRLASMCVAAAILTVGATIANAQTAFEYLQKAPKPVFRNGHTLLPLSRWGWSMAFNTKVELCENWGYALEFGPEGSPAAADALDNPDSEASKLCALTASDPKKYPLAVLVYRPINDVNTYPDGKYPEETFVHDAQGKRLENVAEWKTWSPELPDSIYQRAADMAGKGIAKIRSKAPISILLNGGEYGLNCRGHSGPSWEKDPKVVAAKGDLDWDTYIGRRKAHYEKFISDAVRKAAPDRQLYLLYHYGSMPGWTAVQWVWDYKAMRPIADMPGQMFYYNRYDNTGWTGKTDMLTNALVAHAKCLGFGDKLGYHWVCAGWEDGKFSDRERYMGFLKSLYNSGMIGAVAGYFSYPKPTFTENLGPEIPPWLWQMMDLAQAQALYSHVDEFLREGDLLPGPDKHRNFPEVPAYEFPTGDPTARVLVRKHRKRMEWLISAWAADGPTRNVKVEVPELGEITVEARASGSVYVAKGKIGMTFEPPEIELKRLDADGMQPTAGFAAPTTAPTTQPKK